MIVTGFRSMPGLTTARRLSPASATSPRTFRLQGDGFDVARRASVDLRGLAAPPAISDADFVVGLYRELLGREPDLGGFHSHLKGLEAGLSRDALRRIFLDSAEYRERQARPPVAPPPPAPPRPPARPSPITGEANFDAAYPKIKKLRVAQSARACPNKHATLWTQAFVRGRSNNGWRVTDAQMKALVDASGGSVEKYTKEMIYAVSARMHRTLSKEETRVVIFKVQRQYLAEVEALMRRFGQAPQP